MSIKTSIESIYKVYNDDEGVALVVATDPDGIGLVHISTNNDKKAEEWWGKVDFSMSPEIAENLAKAILKKVKDLRNENS